MTEDDRAIVARCVSGDSRAFGLLVDRYQKPLYNAALRILGDPADAEDATQVAFIRAYENLASYNEDHEFFSWIYRITVNESLNQTKKRKRKQRVFLEIASEDVAEVPPHVAPELTDETDQAMGYLSPEERAILLLKHVEGFTYHEIAFIFEIPMRTVKSRLYSARQRLKNVLVQRGLVQQYGH